MTSPRTPLHRAARVLYTRDDEAPWDTSGAESITRDMLTAAWDDDEVQKVVADHWLVHQATGNYGCSCGVTFGASLCASPRAHVVHQAAMLREWLLGKEATS